MKITPFYTNIWVFETTENFDEELLICTNIEKSTVSEKKSNMLGYQSTNYSGDNLHTLFPNIVTKLHDYISTVATDVNANLVVDNFWFNVNRKHHYNLSHMHPYASYSSVLYLKAHDLCGDLVFENPTTSYAFPLNDKNENNFGIWRERPKQNKLIIFPAYLRHYVEPNMTDEKRVSLTINFRDQMYNSMRPM